MANFLRQTIEPYVLTKPMGRIFDLSQQRYPANLSVAATNARLFAGSEAL
jgi:hypothetical protein